MKCPFCQAQDTKVIDSRPAEDNSSIKRRRQCRENFDRSKIEAGIIQSCHKRPVSTAEIKKTVDEIENQIYAMEVSEIPTRTIGELVMEQLKDLDEVAYVRFASVYREFKDVSTFMDEITKLLKK